MLQSYFRTRFVVFSSKWMICCSCEISLCVTEEFPLFWPTFAVRFLNLWFWSIVISCLPSCHPWYFTLDFDACVCGSFFLSFYCVSYFYFWNNFHISEVSDKLATIFLIFTNSGLVDSTIIPTMYNSNYW